MGWKKELLRGLAEVKGEVGRIQGIIVTQDSTIQRQQQVIEKLLDRIQAGSYKELKLTPSAEIPWTPVATEGFYEPAGDEDIAGMALPMEDRLNGTKDEG
jgi:hypothetical protein